MDDSFVLHGVPMVLKEVPTSRWQLYGVSEAKPPDALPPHATQAISQSNLVTRPSVTALSEQPRSPGPAGIAYYSRFRASFHQPLLPLHRCVAIACNLLHVHVLTTVARYRGNPLDLEVSELERGALATFENPEILDANAGE